MAVTIELLRGQALAQGANVKSQTDHCKKVTKKCNEASKDNKESVISEAESAVYGMKALLDVLEKAISEAEGHDWKMRELAEADQLKRDMRGLRDKAKDAKSDLEESIKVCKLVT